MVGDLGRPVLALSFHQVKHVAECDLDLDPLEHVRDQRNITQVERELEEKVILETTFINLFTRMLYGLPGQADDVANDAADHDAPEQNVVRVLLAKDGSHVQAAVDDQ